MGFVYTDIGTSNCTATLENEVTVSTKAKFIPKYLTNILI